MRACWIASFITNWMGDDAWLHRLTVKYRGMNVFGDVQGRPCLILDDIIDTAGTLVKTVDALLAQGAGKVYACASHPVLSGPAVERIVESRLTELVVTNTIPLRPEAQQVEKIKVHSIAGLLGRAIESIHMETSVSTLFN